MAALAPPCQQLFTGLKTFSRLAIELQDTSGLPKIRAPRQLHFLQNLTPAKTSMHIPKPDNPSPLEKEGEDWGSKSTVKQALSALHLVIKDESPPT